MMVLESVPEDTAKAILEEYPAVFSVDLTLKKPQAPVNADFDYMAVNIVRNRD